MGLDWFAGLARQAVALGFYRPAVRAAPPPVMVPELARAASAVWRQNRRLNAALTGLPQAVLLVDSEGRRACGNPRFAKLFGVSPGAVSPGLPVAALLSQLRRTAPALRADLLAALRELRALNRAGQPAGGLRETADGRSFAFDFRPLPDEGWLLALEDVTERRRAEARTVHLAQHDPLTGLPNRALFDARLEAAAAQAAAGEAVALLCLDLDGFKAVNDRLGHAAGDALLRAVAGRLLAQAREGDTVARLGGDEFAIIQTGPARAAEAEALAARLIEVLAAPFELHGERARIGASIGIALLPQDGATPADALRHADLALYRAKAEGRNRARRFAPALRTAMLARQRWENELRQAIDQGEFELHYQPQMTLQPRAVVGFEALLRWRHPQQGLLAPAAFMARAEESGLIGPLGAWALRRACQDAAHWPGSLGVAVNLSAGQVGHSRLHEEVAAVLAESGLTPRRLTLEIAEASFAQDQACRIAMLHQVRALGVGIALDDFGAGSTSLGFLRRLPVDKVKIDRSCIEGLGETADAEAIVGALTGLCRALGVTAAAEGVETPAQLARLGALLCPEAQGFLFAAPQPASAVPALARRLQAAALGGPNGRV